MSYIPGSFKHKFHIPFWGKLLSKEFLFLFLFPYITSSFKTKFHIFFWDKFLSKEQEFLSITSIPVIPVSFWQRWKELQIELTT